MITLTHGSGPTPLEKAAEQSETFAEVLGFLAGLQDRVVDLSLRLDLLNSKVERLEASLDSRQPLGQGGEGRPGLGVSHGSSSSSSVCDNPSFDEEGPPSTPERG